jgi:hypothetical protein
MRLTIEGTPEEIADAMRKLGADVKEIATPTPQPAWVPAPFYTEPLTVKPYDGLPDGSIIVTCDVLHANDAVLWNGIPPGYKLSANCSHIVPEASNA